jgi:hypothetical protein
MNAALLFILLHGAVLLPIARGVLPSGNSHSLTPALPLNDDGVLVMLVGGARTVLCLFPKIVEHFLKPLDPSRGGADLGAILKYTDPGPKGQEGRWGKEIEVAYQSHST